MLMNQEPDWNIDDLAAQRYMLRFATLNRTQEGRASKTGTTKIKIMLS